MASFEEEMRIREEAEEISQEIKNYARIEELREMQSKLQKLKKSKKKEEMINKEMMNIEMTNKEEEEDDEEDDDEEDLMNWRFKKKRKL